MNPEIQMPNAVQKALIYCRVSSKKQTEDGSGLHSQEYRCRQYAEAKQYYVEEVFPDKVSGGGDFMKRPGMVALLDYLDANPDENYVVIFDDLKRYARDTEFHLTLRRLMKARNARRECLNFNFDDSPEGKFNETIFAATGTLEREQIGRQTRQKSQARIEQGYWTFRAPVGYRYAKSANGGKELVKDEPLASTVKTALEGYATGQFATLSEIQQFLETDPRYPKDTPKGKIRPQTVVRLLSKVVYAGYVEAPKWGISRREGKHEGIISLETFEAIQMHRTETKRLPNRKDISQDFPLRGGVCCSSCDYPLTAGWSSGKCKKYPYYVCQKQGCDEHGKSIPRDKLEGEFAALLKKLHPSENLFHLVKAMFTDAWNAQVNDLALIAQSFKQDALKAETEIKKSIERIMETTNPRVIQAIENRIDELENQKLLALEKASKSGEPIRTFGEMFEHSMAFLSNPHKIWVSGQFEMKRIVLKLVFPERLSYSRSEGLRTPKTTLPFSMLGGLSMSDCEMVPLG
ncbi:recombinase family protein [Sneathiella sp.]|uniref:recombinase family protein n=1 Tax=Sneathiella sp. TaxID=1964365 RepID=UPI00261D0437|nr:recombinase family protein [Sneathiella sp.]MDF2368866.1 recombinase family protein [Sneathiella sp.]